MYLEGAPAMSLNHLTKRFKEKSNAEFARGHQKETVFSRRGPPVPQGASSTAQEAEDGSI